MNLTVRMGKIYRPLFDQSLHQFVLSGGRDSGKTSTSVEIVAVDMVTDPGYDWVIFKADYAELEDSDYSELVALFQTTGLDALFTVTKRPLMIRRNDGSGNIYFKGADAIGSDTSRTHGIKTIHPLKGVIFSETQQFRTPVAFQEAMASIRRNFTKSADGEVSPHWRIIVQGNPPQSEAHWFNQWEAKREPDPDWTILKPSYLDVLPFLNDIDLTEIRKMRAEDPDGYDWLYEGKVGGGWGSAYPMLSRDRHLIPLRDAGSATKGARVLGIVIGADGAVDRDATAFVPWLVLEDGSLVTRSDDWFHFDPKKCGVVSSFPLCDEGGPAWRWWFGWKGRDGVWVPGLASRYPSISNPAMSVPIWFFVDSAAPELKQSLQINLCRRGLAECHDVKKGTIISMVEVCRNAFGRRPIPLARFIDCGGTWDYLPPPSASNPTRQPVFRKGFLPAYDEFAALRMDETGLKYDDTLPNDDSDAGTYGLWSWFRNPSNIVFGAKMVR